MVGGALVVHYWAVLQSVNGFRCYDNRAPNAKWQGVLVLTLSLVNFISHISLCNYDHIHEPRWVMSHWLFGRAVYCGENDATCRTVPGQHRIGCERSLSSLDTKRWTEINSLAHLIQLEFGQCPT